MVKEMVKAMVKDKFMDMINDKNLEMMNNMVKDKNMFRGIGNNTFWYVLWSRKTDKENVKDLVKDMVTIIVNDKV